MRVVVGAAGRADKILGEAVAGSSRKLLSLAFADGRVRVNGRRARKGDPVAPGDVIEVDVAPDRASLLPVPQPELGLEIVWQDEGLLGIAKPPGMPSMPLHAGERGTLANALVARFPECAPAGADPREAGLVHRLDASTSGVILAARTPAVWQALRAAFHAGRVRKEYLALVLGAVDQQAVIELPIAHATGGGVRASEGGGLPALTEVRPERRLGKYTLVRCLARTGRMHQIRAHLAAAGWPCVGDLQYGAPASELATDGAFLHAARIELVHPVTGASLTVEAALPRSRQQILATLE